jgi:hypothetical protein
MKQNLLASLKKELENSFGRKIVSSRDCIQMVEDIYQKTGDTINANTLRRFFGLVKADYPPSSSTVTILSRYCGFNSMDDIEQLSTVEDPAHNINKEEVVRYMVSLFRSTQVMANQENTFYPLVEQSIIFLERNFTLIDKFQREIAKTTTGQYYYYEKFPNLDRLNGYYADGLRHYLLAKKTEEGKLFANSMLVFRYWLTKNKERLLTHMADIIHIVPAANVQDHILGRLIAAKLYYANVKGIPIEKILAESKRYHAGIIADREDSSFAFPDYELIICEALLLTGHYDEGAEYIWHGKTYLSTSGQDKNTLFNLWEEFLNSRREGKIRKKEHSHDQSYYNTFSRKYTMIIKLLSVNNLQRRTASREEQLEDLIRETGYKRLLQLTV